MNEKYTQKKMAKTEDKTKCVRAYLNFIKTMTMTTMENSFFFLIEMKNLRMF